jgi:peroxiredoxin
VGVSADAGATLQAFTRTNDIRFPLLSDFRRQMLPAYDAMVTDEKSPIYRYAKRAYFILDRQGIVRYIKVQDNALDLLSPEEVLKTLKESGAA